jgi:hypothetical protein
VLNEVNWCFEEYQQFLKGNEKEVTARTAYRDAFRKRFCAIVAGRKRDDVCPHRAPFDYEPWINHIFLDQHYLTLPKDPEQFEVTIR